MSFWAVSDMNATDLGEFVRLYRANGIGVTTR